jgi:hypothetical protein
MVATSPCRGNKWQRRPRRCVASEWTLRTDVGQRRGASIAVEHGSELADLNVSHHSEKKARLVVRLETHQDTGSVCEVYFCSVALGSHRLDTDCAVEGNTIIHT